MSVELRFVPNDLWIGLYWERKMERWPAFYKEHDWEERTVLHLYVCLLPMLPFHVRIYGRWVKV